MKNFKGKILNKDNAERYIIIFVLTLLPIMACYIINGSISKVYLPNSPWNDEIFYYKMIGAFADYNEPLGYFGYNESHAAIGNLGPWSPFLLLPYVLYAKLIGWSLMSPIYCNLLMMTAAMFVFVFLVRPDRKQAFFICVVYCLNYYYTRYIFSVMVETYINALFLLFFSISFGMFKELGKGHTKGRKFIVVTNILAVLMTLARPYYVLLFVVPGYCWYKTSSKKLGIILQTIIAGVCILLYFVCSKYFCAAYFTDIVETEWLKMIFTDTFMGIRNALKILISSTYQMLRYIGNGIVSGDMVGSSWAVMLAVCVWIYYRWHEDNKNMKFFWAYCLVYLLLMILAVYYMYSIYTGSRHIATFTFIAIFMVAVFEKSNKLKAYIAVLFIWCFCIRATDTYYYEIPTYTDEKAAVIQSGVSELSGYNMIDEYSDNPWDNTIIWMLSDSQTLDFTCLYAVPDGMGINLCTQEYVQNHFDSLEAKYIMTYNGGGIDSICSTLGKELLAEYSDVHIWRLRGGE
ncbi:MAG: hypothetical protein NC313_14815 [Butyrivibrio sp.]|nr:hypothetical protein [Butyrivibrio sp.]